MIDPITDYESAETLRSYIETLPSVYRKALVSYFVYNEPCPADMWSPALVMLRLKMESDGLTFSDFITN